ncbi:spindle and kinetochore-associated 2 isoform X1 [Olea europaea subsp. europaea]|uniref:ER membrane protein complex subunit 4 n=1 Tax=Olea europaea subsp. europaea TaxID=158383 RepID=A0A8S0T585_OLEEU|nr:spindle and kinetochore-associated 2 isoform X1 [Olea europaea subsp. europaea]
MGHRNLENQQHQAVDGLLNLFSKANRDLSMVYNKLQKEFQQVYPDHANPMKLVTRLKKIEEEMSSLKNQCRELLTAKQDLIDKARTILEGNRSMVQRLQASTGIPITSESDDPAYVSFNQANPMKLVTRLKKIEEEMSSLKNQCRELLTAKQDLIDKARTILEGNRSMVQRLQASTGIPITSESDDPAYVSFNQVIDEWTAHVRSRTEDEMEVSPSDNINQLLFSAIVQVFEPYKDNRVDLLAPKLVFTALNLVGLGMGIWKLNTLGLLPTHVSDWVSSIAPAQEVEYSDGGIPLY